jgi:hypothetical protein
MFSHRDHSVLILGMLFVLGVVACRRTEDDSAVLPQTPALPSVDTNKAETPSNEQVIKPRAVQKLSKKKKIIREAPDSTHTTVIARDNNMLTTDKPIKDTNAALSFYIRESFANALRTPSLKTDKPFVHPDSQRWKDIAGIPQPHEETPGWVTALGLAKGVAAVLAVVYYLFFDH